MFQDIPPEVFHGSSIWRKLRFIVGLLVLVGLPLGVLVLVAVSLDYGSLWSTWTKIGLALIGIAIVLSLFLPRHD